MEKCNFCAVRMALSYDLKSFPIGVCEECGTFRVLYPPSESDLERYYQGFSFQASLSSRKLIETSAINAWMLSLGLPKHGRMLDIGGGGGFFAKAFEEFNLGDSTVVDIDKAACDFAKNELELSRVLCRSIESGISELGEFDFIYCRHVIEHLVHPEKFIKNCLDLLGEEGVFVLQFPNGKSKEQAFLYPRRWYNYLKNYARDNKINVLSAYAKSLSKNYGFGIDPPRHLWALDPRAVADYVSGLGFTCSWTTASIADPIYSPYTFSRTFFGKMRDTIARVVGAKAFGGSHAVLEIRNSMK